MLVSTKGRYGLRVMLDIAAQSQGTFVSLKSVAERQDISLKYLEAIVSQLGQKGLLESQRGKDGGYRLTRSAQTYTVWEILCCVEGNMAPVACLCADGEVCDRALECLTLPLWRELDRRMGDFLSAVTLADLLSGEFPW